MRSRLLIVLVLALLSTTVQAQTAAENEQWRRWNDPVEQYVEPFRIFDHVYYVGMRFVSAYLVDTGDGLILIDALFGPHVERLLENVRSFGFDPLDIRYVLVTHGHFDHAGGARRLQEATGARIGMSGPDWDLLIDEPGEGRARFVPPARDLVIEDGQVIALGTTRIECLRTPGHTDGVLSFRFTVRDGERSHQALVFGGFGLIFDEPDRLRIYIRSVDRLLGLDGIDVSLPNHLPPAVLARGSGLAERAPGAAHPFVDADALERWLKRLRERATQMLDDAG